MPTSAFHNNIMSDEGSNYSDGSRGDIADDDHELGDVTAKPRAHSKKITKITTSLHLQSTFSPTIL